MGKNSSKSFKFITYLILFIGVVVSLFPFYWMVVLSSKENREVFQTPPSFTLGNELINNIMTVFQETNFVNAFFNTLYVATVQTVLILIFATLAGFSFAKLKFKGKKLFFNILMATMMIPGQLNIIPQFFLMDRLGWVGSYKALIIPGMVNAFGIFWIKQYCEEGIHDSLIESARIDGATTFQILNKIVVPIIRPALSFLALYSFMGAWNDYMWPLIILNDESKYTLQLALTQLQGLYTTNYPLVITGSLLSVLPIVIIFVIFSKQLIAGISDGAIKG
ncbi:carbohydrate ABC transporter permease [Fundicoccus culcitae]|uniref:Carbohydrate ABC transporter permease n=1 Tax=Fundicoccus culcitae TaxID=2969821 RepID=A0ABY5P940_9LACT|nr:carbohydrate ABC transporter permease [Fundicoccus culcitae]UUX35276.1 carbohydrate ABC transporter permease [Fundicoccus culcitae]